MSSSRKLDNPRYDKGMGKGSGTCKERTPIVMAEEGVPVFTDGADDTASARVLVPGLKLEDKQPLGEVFGYPVDDMSKEAKLARKKKLCPFKGQGGKCTKVSKTEPLGVCSIHEKGALSITCPVRFREDDLITQEAAKFFFDEHARYAQLPEIRLAGENGRPAGNIDNVLVSYDEQGQVEDFGALEIQSVYISGNIKKPFDWYMKQPATRHDMQWNSTPRADYLSSSRKRLMPQLVIKGGILQQWNKKMAVAVQSEFFNTLPELEEVPKDKAKIAWLLHDYKIDKETSRYRLVPTRTVYTDFENTVQRLTTTSPGEVESFQETLQAKLDEALKDQ